MAADGHIAGDTEALSVALTETAHPAVRALCEGEVVAERSSLPGASQSALAVPLVGMEGTAGVLLFRDLTDSARGWPGTAADARILGALAGAVLRNLDLLTRLHSANAELRRANTLKDQLLANASHDLRTPLNVIIGYGQLAMEGTFGQAPGELQDVIGRMVKSACEQLTLVEDLLNLSRIELNILPVKPVNVPLSSLFSEMEFMVAGLVQDRPIRPVVAPVPAELRVRADPDRLRQILTNLLTNAAKFTDTGVIELRARWEGPRVQLVVRDTGIGIAPEHQSIIFDPFTQVDTERAQMGTGLGLAIARRLAHMMGGNLTVESELGRGSTFYLTLSTGMP
jgi:signal transduction histidine kinase